MTADDERGPYYKAIPPHLLPLLDPLPPQGASGSEKETPTMPIEDSPEAYFAAVQARIDIAARGLNVLLAQDAPLVFDQYARRRTPDQCFKSLLLHLADRIASLDLEPKEQKP